ncbi:CLUMA_CG006062, isoform A [Clunio marinus]|uniref:CLUMA_CG006062, isoform A n=1 Tax=Clunio marinus TaxID=568069 RepID=A0A1J1HWU9_9DIPT|nr:CLUMA_CG006062, isoform A [Clunio marinus]
MKEKMFRFPYLTQLFSLILKIFLTKKLFFGRDCESKNSSLSSCENFFIDQKCSKLHERTFYIQTTSKLTSLTTLKS